MKIPVVLPTVHIDIDTGGHLTVDVDGDPHPAAAARVRGDLRAVLDSITTDLGTAVRVEVREHDGTTYSDIATPPTEADATPELDAAPTGAPDAHSTSSAGIRGPGFLPGEEVAVTYVVCTRTADGNGWAAVQLPAALLSKSGLRMLLVGMTSAAVAEVEPT